MHCNLHDRMGAMRSDQLGSANGLTYTLQGSGADQVLIVGKDGGGDLEGGAEHDSVSNISICLLYKLNKSINQSLLRSHN